MPPPDPASHWEHFPHGADIGVRGRGPTLEAAFAAAGLALIGVIADPATIASRDRVEIECTAPDRELLLVEWLNAIIFEIASRHMLFGWFHVTIDGTSLRAVARGEPIDVARHHPAVEVKGATMTALRVAQDGSGMWTAQTIVDV